MTGEEELKIKDYIRKYAIKHGITYEEAKEHAMCQMAARFYGVKGENNNERNDIFR